MKRAICLLAALTAAGCTQDDPYQPLDVKVSFSPSELVVKEGETETVTVKLDMPIYANFSLTVGASSNAVTLSTTQLNFSSGQTEAYFDVSAPSDVNAVNETATITVTGGFTSSTLPVTVRDTEGINLNIVQKSPTGTTITEGTSVVYGVTLDKQPTQERLTVAVSVPEGAPFAIEEGTWEVTQAAWNTEHEVTLSGRMDDNLVDDDVTVTFRLGGELAATKTLTVTDTSVQAIVASPTSLTIPEGEQSALGVRLAYEPTENVTVTLSPSDASRLALSATSLSFTPANYATVQSVAVTASADDDTVNDSLSIALSGGGASLSVPVQVYDEDVVGFTISPQAATLDEGEGGSFTVALSHQPLANVSATVTAENSAAVTLTAGQSLSFTPTNWSTPQTVRFTTAADFDTTPTTSRVLVRSSSAEVQEAGVYTLTLNDSDSQGVVVSGADSLSVSENGGTASFRVHLAQSGSLTVNVASSDGNRLSVSPSSLSFSASNYQTDQTITVTGRQDSDAGDNTVFVQLSSGGSTSSVPVTVEDHTQQVISLSSVQCLHWTSTTDGEGNLVYSSNSLEDCAIVQEEGPAAIVSVHLEVPLGDGSNTVNITPADTSKLYVEPKTLTFTGSGYNVDQQVRVYAIGDPDSRPNYVDDTSQTERETVLIQVSDTRTPAASASIATQILDDDFAEPDSGEWYRSVHPTGTENADFPLAMPANRFVRKTVAWNPPYVGFLIANASDEIKFVVTDRILNWGDDQEAPRAVFGARPSDDHANSATILPAGTGFAALANVSGNTHYAELARPPSGEPVNGSPTIVSGSTRDFGDSIGNAMARADEITGLGFVRDGGAVEFLRMNNSTRADIGSAETIGSGATWVNVEYMSHSQRFMVLYGAANEAHCVLRDLDGAAVGQAGSASFPTDGLATTYDDVGRRVVAAYMQNSSGAHPGYMYAVSFGDDCVAGTPSFLDMDPAQAPQVMTDPDVGVDPPQIAFNGAEFGLSTNVTATQPSITSGSYPEARFVRVNENLVVKDEFTVGIHDSHYPAVAWAGDRWFMQYPVRRDDEGDFAQGRMRMATGNYKDRNTDGQQNFSGGVAEIGVDCTEEEYCASEATAVLSDGPADDLTPAQFNDFLSATAAATARGSHNGLGTRADDWIFVEITAGGQGGAICFKNAGWYFTQLQQYGVLSGTVTEPYPWEHYYRPEGGSWSSASSTPLENLFGGACDGAYSWCIPAVGGGAGLSLMPANEAADECGVDGVSHANASWTVQMKVGASRTAACGAM